MYVNSGANGLPFYGYAQNGSPVAYSYVDGGDANKWKLLGATGTSLTVTTIGNVGIGTTAPTNKLHVAGGVSATAFVSTSDRAAKENFKPISPRSILAKVADLPISTWTFKEMKDGEHLGPVAQDFYASFGLGGSERTITTTDEGGVALAAIQGLNQKVDEKDGEIQNLKRQNQSLEARVSQMEALLQQLTQAK